MEKYIRQIPWIENYSIDLISNEIYNKRGSKMSQFIDARGRLSVRLSVDKGRQKTFVVRDILRKMDVSLGITPLKASIEHQIVLCYWDNLNEDTRYYSIMEWSEFVKKEVQDEVSVLAVGRTLSRLRTYAT